jgi:hypothetical protein
MGDLSLDHLQAFIVRAKAATYIGGGPACASCRPGSHDLRYDEGAFAYLDSYFGGADFVGEEVVYFEGRPVWAMNYYGRLLDPSRITAAEVGQVLRESLSALYREGRFLGGWEYATARGPYADANDGDLTSFTGREWITCGSVTAYELVYHGGLIKD